MIDVPFYSPLPLNHIRVLHVHGTKAVQQKAGPITDLAIDCTLETATLTDIETGVVVYEALSYVWGSALYQRSLVCNGLIRLITPNLHDALWHLLAQATQLPLRLWVDAVCINQDDIDEKNRQVGIIGQIFQNATRVIAWLGSRAENNSREVDEFWEHFMLYDKQQAAGSRAALPSSGKSLSTEALKAGHIYLSQCGWFRRRWTFSEAIKAVSLQVVQGHHSFSWEVLCKYIRQYCGREPREDQSLQHAEIRLLEHLDAIESCRHAYRRSLKDLVWYSRNRRATNPHDVVYSLLSVYTGTWRFPIDYSQNFETTNAQLLVSLAEEEGYLPAMTPALTSAPLLRLASGEILASYIPTWQVFPEVGHKELKYPVSTAHNLDLIHTSFKMLLQLSGSCLNASGVVLGYRTRWTILSKDIFGDRKRHTFKSQSEPLQDPVHCVQKYTSEDTEHPNEPSGRALLDPSSYRPLTQDAGALCRLLFAHESCECMCGTQIPTSNYQTEEDYAKDRRDFMERWKKVQASDRRQKMAWICLIFGMAQPVVLETLYNEDTGGCVCALRPDLRPEPEYQETVNLLREGKVRVDRGKTGGGFSFGAKDTNVQYGFMNHLTEAQRKEIGAKGWKTPEDIPGLPNFGICWFPTTFSLLGSEADLRVLEYL